jgi:hypothetical protein
MQQQNWQQQASQLQYSWQEEDATDNEDQPPQQQQQEGDEEGGVGVQNGAAAGGHEDSNRSDGSDMELESPELGSAGTAQEFLAYKFGKRVQYDFVRLSQEEGRCAGLCLLAEERDGCCGSSWL